MYRVVIADDEPKVAQLIRNLIQWEELGLELVAMAGDGITALELIETHLPDIVITDIRMPGYDGIELISKAKSVHSGVDFIIISGYKHFEYAQKAIRFGVEDYLLKPLKAAEINQTLSKMTEKYRIRDQQRVESQQAAVRREKDMRLFRENLVASLINTGDKPFAEPVPSEMVEFVAEDFQGILIKPDIHYETMTPRTLEMLLDKTAREVMGRVAPHCKELLLYPHSDRLYCVINVDASKHKKIRKALIAVIDELQSQSEIFDRIKVTVGMGGIVKAFSMLPGSLRGAEHAVANRIICGPGRIIDHAVEQDTDQVISEIIGKDIRNALLKGVEILDSAILICQMRTIEQLLDKKGPYAGKSVLGVCHEVVQIIHFGLKSQNTLDSWGTAREEVFHAAVGMCNRQKELFQILEDYGRAVVAHCIEERKSENSRPIREAQKYIQANFDSPISLDTVSQQVGFNAAYFSQLFKKETGVNFLEYLTDLRIKEAKRLLANPRKTIADIALDVGYSDVKHFSKLFAKSAGIQPSQYRKLYY